jgi:hypothetical protein
MDQHGLSLDVHAVRDALLRIGKNEASGQSLLMDLAGGIAAALGKDNLGRSVTATLDGGCELVVGPNQQGQGLQLEIRGDVNWLIKGHFNIACTGDYTLEASSIQTISKTDIISKAQNQFHSSLSQVVTESPNITDNQGLYASTPND